MGGDYQQEIDCISLFKDVAGEYVHMCTDAAQMRQLVDRAVRIALTGAPVTCIIVPKGARPGRRGEATPHSQYRSYRNRLLLPTHHSEPEGTATGSRYSERGEEGLDLDWRRGDGRWRRGDRGGRPAGLRRRESLTGKAALPDDLPFVTGGLGLLGTTPSWNMMMNCDTLLMAGSNFPYAEFLPKEGQARGIHIDIDGRLLSMRYPMELALIGDSVQSLLSISPSTQAKGRPLMARED